MLTEGDTGYFTCCHPIYDRRLGNVISNNKVQKCPLPEKSCSAYWGCQGGSVANA